MRTRLILAALAFSFLASSAWAHSKQEVSRISHQLQKIFDHNEREAERGGYVFDPAVLGDIAKKGVGLPTEAAFDTIQSELIAHYGDHVAPRRHWIFNDAGAALGELTLLHCSTREYLIFFGTPIGTEGYSGRYSGVEFWDFVLQGQMLTYQAGETTAHAHNPGEFGYMGDKQSKGYRIVGPSWLLEYGRGSILHAFDFGVISPARYVTRDWSSAWDQIYDCGKLAIGEIFGHHSRQAEAWHKDHRKELQEDTEQL